MSKSPQKKQRDPLLGLKYKAYCLVHVPPGESMKIEDLVNLGKWYLCNTLGYLWKDPIWEQYTDEEILIEYFSHLFAKDKELQNEFKAQISNGEDDEDIYAWLDQKIAENEAERKQKLEELPEKVSFSPDGKDVEE